MADELCFARLKQGGRGRQHEPSTAATAGAVLALDPRTGRRLWSSEQESAGGTIGAIHWESPIAVNGRLHMSDESGAISAYGLPGN